MTRSFLVCIFLFTFFATDAQFKNVERIGTSLNQLQKPNRPPSFEHSTPKAQRQDYNAIGQLQNFRIQERIRAVQFDHNKMPIYVKGRLGESFPSLRRQASAYLESMAPLYQIENFQEEWKVEEIREDAIGMQHMRVQQYKDDVPVYGGELILHAKAGVIVNALGRGYPTPTLPSTQPTLQKEHARRKIKEHLSAHPNFINIPQKQKDFLNFEQIQLELVVYHEEEKASAERLAYFVKAYTNLAVFETYFMDAHTGEFIHQHSNICKFAHDHSAPPDGPKTAIARDLNGINRTLNTYEVNGNFFLIDATKPNFSLSQSSMPDDPKGVIWTLDANNTSPQSDDFEIFHVGNNDNLSWLDRSSVSAHYNAGEAFDYFREVHNRNAIDGSGGNIISFINVTDEDDKDMDNAFWNGIAMFYGNGSADFTPLAGGLDVAGHEMSHGVVQASANLNYEGESGALNESFADVFGAMMDRDDYQIGEDVVTNSFPSGALRDMADPNNGGNQLGDIGWQPKHVNEQYFGDLDNGGVHINSGIPNHAFFLLAEAIGKNKAEKIYYRALNEYLTRSSRFVDARNAVILSAQDLYGNAEVAAAENAFSQVGIGEGSGGDYTNDAQVNQGQEYIIYTAADNSKLTLVNSSLQALLDPASAFPPISVPSVTDDGSLIYYVTSDNKIAFTAINWDTEEVSSGIVSDQEIWSNVVISKDGNRMAAVEIAQSPRIQIYDFNKQEWYRDAFGEFGFELYNPTFTQGVSTGDAKFADAMEFDISGEILMYDVYSEIEGSFGQNIGFWDIGFLRAWNNSTNDWGDGNISKLFSSLAEGISVGNPTFSKNSPYIIAFDYIEGNEYSVLAANVETGDIGLVFENSGLGYPSYTGTDGQMIFTNETTFDTDIFLVDMDDSKIFPVANSVGQLIADGRNGVVFRNGSRILSSVSDAKILESDIDLYPNPTHEKLNISIGSSYQGPIEIQITSIDGKVQMVKKQNKHSKELYLDVDVSALVPGIYSVQLLGKGNEWLGSNTFSKQ